MNSKIGKLLRKAADVAGVSYSEIKKNFVRLSDIERREVVFRLKMMLRVPIGEEVEENGKEEIN